MVGVPYDCEKVIVTCLEPNFEQRLSRTLEMKEKLLETQGKSLEYKRCPLDLLYDFYGAEESYELHKSAFLINH